MSELIKSNEIKYLTDKLLMLVDDVLAHDGYGDIHIEVKILKRQQKEVIIHYGKQYRFVVECPQNLLSNPL
ncbi:MAG TPA: hypothetical protein VK999_06160 [Methylotenera sp.]|nr:hypothetical protein [Methylotenera sp.]